MYIAMCYLIIMFFLVLLLRACDNPAPSNGGVDCSGSSSESSVCLIMNYCLPSIVGNTDQVIQSTVIQ